MSPRRFERLWCPGCQRLTAAYVPRGGDGSGLHIVAHNLGAKPCRYAERVVVPDGQGGWKLDP